MEASLPGSTRLDVLRPPPGTFLPFVPAALSAASEAFAWSMISGADGICLTGVILPILLGVLLGALALALLPLMWWGARDESRACVAAWTAVVALLLAPAGFLAWEFGFL